MKARRLHARASGWLPEMTQGRGWTDTDASRLRLEALEHLNRLLSGEATDRDAAALIAWRAESRAHEEAFRAAVRLRSLVQQVETRPQSEGPTADPIERADAVILPFAPRTRPPVLNRRGLIGGALAASLAGGALVTGRLLDWVPSPGEAMAAYRTGPGERRTIALDGGAVAELNTRTSIDLHSGMAMPAIDLIAGEALLTSGRGRAALVAGPGSSVVRGGRLNARREGEQVCITCLAGMVEIAWREQGRILRPAQELRYDNDAIGAVISGVDAMVRTAWQAGTLIFRNMPLRDVVHEINRYRPGKIFVADAALAARRLSGTFRTDDLDDFFNQARLALDVRVTRLPGNVVILG
ncbi:hypothetical protein S2M10_00410 [Sphingomonas sp. S2M10]|uniref:FecR family protein n=1 Tax=Sphingomonas sp. S2M10 TaxID=2705010 RepID=UPI0016ABB7E9|nr:FecR domain-containing protein [Sphingomonas sp. S2M10]NLS25078.1 hypothetical protein [Sphingomonas sp. S2M10]